MPSITLNEEQAKILSESNEAVEFRDPQGRPIALVRAMDPVLVETILECKRRLAGDTLRIPSARVQAFLQHLDSLAQREEVTREKVDDLLARVRAGETV